MLHSIVKFAGTSLLCLTLGSLAACGNVSRDVARDGHSAGQLVWPAPESTTPMRRGGTFPNLDNLRQIRAGLNKQQIAHLIGYPHFSEGMMAVREWNYLLNFRQSGSDQVTVCQYKILFDDNRLAQSFYWKPTSCSQLSMPPGATASSSTESPKEQVFTLSTDALFAFDKSSVDDITNNGKAQLDDLAHRMIAAGSGVRIVHIAGYTDRLGGYPAMLTHHRNLNITAEQRFRFSSLMSLAADDAKLPADPEFRAAFVGYLEWGTRLAVHNSQPGADVAQQAPVPRWGWGVAPPYQP